MDIDKAERLPAKGVLPQYMYDFYYISRETLPFYHKKIMEMADIKPL